MKSLQEEREAIIEGFNERFINDIDTELAAQRINVTRK